MGKVAFLSHFFTNQTLIDVFLCFLLNPHEPLYLSEIVNSTGKALIQVQRTLKRLVETGLVQKTIRHKKAYYSVDAKHIAFEEVKHLVIKAKIFSNTFRHEVQHLAERVNYGFIYGSVAKGTNTTESDVDLFLIGNLDYEAAGPFIFKLGRELVQEVNVVILSPPDFIKGLQCKSQFLLHVVQEPKIWLFGDKDEFEEIYCKRLPFREQS